MKKVAFICVHNSCRSQIAEALGNHLASDVDIAISMGCNVGCPFIGRSFDDNWGLDDPSGKLDDDFKIVIQQIEQNIIELKKVLIER